MPGDLYREPSYTKRSAALLGQDRHLRSKSDLANAVAETNIWPAVPAFFVRLVRSLSSPPTGQRNLLCLLKLRRYFRLVLPILKKCKTMSYKIIICCN